MNKIPFWSKTPDELFRELESTPDGLRSDEAERRFRQAAGGARKFALPAPLRLFLAQFRSFVTLILLLSAVLSLLLSDRSDGFIILGILFVTAFLSFWQEHGAERAVKRLSAMVQLSARVLRDRASARIPAEQVVPGDVTELSAGDLIPGDCLLLEAKDLFVDESPLTGETFPAEKRPGVTDAASPLSLRENALWFGTHVVSGTGRALVAGVGRNTEFGEIQKRLSSAAGETDFQRGIGHFGAFLGTVTFILVFTVFFFNVYFHRPIFESLLFSLALAVGLTPQLLPAVISVNLAYGAAAMAAKKVIVRRLASIENLGSMDILCSDKTGTLTEGKIRLKQAVSAKGDSNPNNENDPEILRLALLNAAFQTGFANPLDKAILQAGAEAGLSVSDRERLDEVPYDFLRKRLSVLVRPSDGRPGGFCVSKGAFFSILEVCDRVRSRGGDLPLTEETRQALTERFETFGDAGLRTLGLAVKITEKETLSREDETEMTFVGFLTFEDPVREDTAEVVEALRRIGVRLCIITGDNARVAATIARQSGVAEPRILTGRELRRTGDGALIALAERTDVFAEVEPNQKERLVLALKKGGHVVGYMGDGINDISALHAADASISADGAVDAAKRAADMVLLEHNLHVLLEGVLAGRRTFANTMKYIFMATSANFGNMFSMACAALFLPFLPMLPRQILLTNVLTDMPEIILSADSVDPELTAAPQRWNIGFIRSFMIRFGLLSSVFDILTFMLLLLLSPAPEFVQTGWFVESVVSAALIVLLIRTRTPIRQLWKNPQKHPGWLLVAACALSALIAVLLPFSRFGQEFLGFVPLPPSLLALLIVIVLLYMTAVEAVKRFAWPEEERRTM